MRPSRVSLVSAATVVVAACSNPAATVEKRTNPAESAKLEVLDSRGGNTLGSGNKTGLESTDPSVSDDRGGNTMGSGNRQEPIEPVANQEASTDSVSISSSDSRGGNTMGSGH